MGAIEVLIAVKIGINSKTKKRSRLKLATLSISYTQLPFQ